MKAAVILILKLTLILATALGCVLAGYYHGRNKFYKEGLEHGAARVESEIAGCTLEMAHKGECLIPCENYTDCVNKNGHPEREY